jgi:hypothetical protein
MGASDAGSKGSRRDQARDQSPWRTRRTSARKSPPAGHSVVGAAVVALRQGREAIVEIDGHLDDVLDWLHDPRRGVRPDLPNRLASSARRAGEALAALGGPAGSELF